MMAQSTRNSTPQTRRDRALVRRLLAGDEAAFEQFFADYSGGLFRFALTRLDFDEDLAKEVVQATLCTAIEKLETFRGEAALFTWMTSICRGEISAHFKQRRRVPVALDPIEETPEIRRVLESLAAGLEGPEDELRHKEVVRLVHLTLDYLPPRYGRALEWKYLEGLSVREIAGRLETTTKAAESILTRARDAFRIGFERLCEGLEEREEGWQRSFRGLRAVT